MKNKEIKQEFTTLKSSIANIEKRLESLYRSIKAVADVVRENDRELSAKLSKREEIIFRFPPVEPLSFNYKTEMYSLPKFKVGDWFVPHKPENLNIEPFWFAAIMDRFDNMPIRVQNMGDNGWLIYDFYKFHPDWCEKWVPKRGEYVYYITKTDTDMYDWIVIFKEISEFITTFAMFDMQLRQLVNTNFQNLCLVEEISMQRPATPSEIALLDQKLAEQGKRFDREKCELVDVEKPEAKCEDCAYAIATTCFCHVPECRFTPKTQPINKPSKPLVIGEPAIFWDNDKSCAVMANYKGISPHQGYQFKSSDSRPYKNAIPFESVEQYKQFIKE